MPEEPELPPSSKRPKPAPLQKEMNNKKDGLKLIEIQSNLQVCRNG